MVAVFAFIGYFEGFPFNRNLFKGDSDRSCSWSTEKRPSYYYDIVNNLFGFMLVFGELLTLKSHSEALSTRRAST